MNFGNIKYCDIADGLGCRTTVFVSGCRNHCKDCFQPETWDFGYGFPFDDAAQEEVIDSLRPYYIKGLTLLGGEPFEPENQEALLPFIKEVRRQCPDKDIWAYTGYVYDKDLVEGGRRHTQDTDELLSLIDVLVDGPFVTELKKITLKFRGSENQRVIDMKETLKSGNVVLFMD